MYNPMTHQWSFLSELKKPRIGCCMVEIGEVLYVLGGHSENEYWKHVEKLDIDADDWTDGPAMNTARSCFSIQVCAYALPVVKCS